MTSLLSQTEIEDTLAALFASSARLAVLRVLLVDPQRAYYQRQLEKISGVLVRGVQRELERLTESHLLYRHSEGRRAYYRVDMEHPLFHDLRALILRGTDPVTRLRAALAVIPGLRLVFGREADSRVLVVGDWEASPEISDTYGHALTWLTTSEFTRRLGEDQETLRAYLGEGHDWLGRRDDVIWRRIEAAGFRVDKGKGIP